VPSCQGRRILRRIFPFPSELERVLGDRRTQDVSEVLEPLSVTRRHGNSRVEVEATELSLPLGDHGAKRWI
jgi:hypothetical protein